MKKLLIFLSLCLFTVPAYSQYGNTITTWGSGAPAGTCISVVQRYVDSANGNTYSCDVATNAWKLSAPASAISGSGTANTIAKFTAAGAIGNSQITDTGSLVSIPSSTIIKGNYALKWTDNAGTTDYLYIIGNATNSAVASVNKPFQLQYGVLGASVQLSVDTGGNVIWNYDYADADFSIFKQTAGVAYSYTAGTDVHAFSGTVTLATPLGSAYGGTGANNTATNTYYLKGNGTNFVTSSGAASGTGTCTNQFARVLNSDAAPTCESVTGADIASGYTLLKRQTTTLTASKLKEFNAVNVLTQATDSGDSTIYAGTFPNCAANACADGYYTTAGLDTGANNGTFKCTASTTTDLTLNNPNGVNETHAGTATNLGFLVVSAPGASKLIQPVSWTLQYKYNTTAFTIANPDNSFTLDYAGLPIASTNEAYYAATGLVDQAANMIGSNIFYAYAQTEAATANKDLVIGLAGTTPALTLGAGTLYVTVAYHEVTMQ